MLSVTLVLTNPEKGAKLLALLEELPFVEIQSCQPMQPPVPVDTTILFERYIQHEGLGWQHGAWKPIQVFVFKGIAGTAEREFGSALSGLYEQLATDPGLFEAQILKSNERTAYCVYRSGFRVLYELSHDSKVLRVFHIAKS
jgi:hypothetical protein